MYLWSVNTFVTNTAMRGRSLSTLVVTSTLSYEEAQMFATNLVGVTQEINLLGQIPGTAPSTINGTKIKIMYGTVAFKYPRVYDSGANLSNVRQIITDWSLRMDLAVGQAFKPVLPVGPLPRADGDPAEIGRLSTLASIVEGSSMVEEFISVVSGEIFRGEVPPEDIQVLYLRDASTLATDN